MPQDLQFHLLDHRLDGALVAGRPGPGGAGIPAFFTKTGVGTLVAEGKPTQEFDGETYVRETWLKADLASHHNMCTLAYYHQSRFSSGGSG